MRGKGDLFEELAHIIMTSPKSAGSAGRPVRESGQVRSESHLLGSLSLGEG